MRPLNITLTTERFEAVLSGMQRTVSTKKNPRKARYFAVKRPKRAKIRAKGAEPVLFLVDRIELINDIWVIYLF